MSRKAKIWIIAILGFLLILVLGIAASDSRRNREDVSSTDGHETSASVSVEEYQKEQDTIMAEMMKDMEDVPESGNAAVTYLNGMIPHHQAAVAMAESYLEHGGQDEELKKLAGDMIKVQNEEIDQMKTMVERLLKHAGTDEEAESAYLEKYGSMIHGSHNAHITAGNIDHAFAEGMKMHHQMAIDMSEAVLNHTEDEETVQLAENIIKLQKTEIDQMDGILKRRAEQ